MRTVPSGQRRIGPRANPEESRTILMARTRRAFAEMSGDVVFLFEHPSPEVLFAPPSFDTPPKWMNAYVTGNPSLFPFSDLTPRRTPVKRLPWRKLPGTDNPSGFPKLYLPRAKSIGMHDIDPARLPQDAVRSPSFRFALLPNRYDKRGVWQLDGDDGLEVRLADLQAKISGRLYYSGMYGAWPVGATWFTDRFLLVAGAGPLVLMDKSGP